MTGPTDATAGLDRPGRCPPSRRYDPAWVLALDRGPHPLWRLASLLPALRLDGATGCSTSRYSTGTLDDVAFYLTALTRPRSPGRPTPAPERTGAG